MSMTDSSPDPSKPQPSRPRRPGRPVGSVDQGPQVRERIREAAIDLFSANGYHATGVAEIGARAGLKAGALYYHIGSKQQLLWTVLRDHVEEALSEADSILASDNEPKEKLRDLIRSHVRVIAAHRREVAIYMRDGEALTGEPAELLQSLRDRVENVWQQVLTEGKAAGQFESDDHAAVNGLLGMVNTIYMWYRPEQRNSPDQIATILSNMVIQGLLDSGARE